MLNFYFQQLGQLVKIIKQHIRNYLDDVFALVKEFWGSGANIQITIVGLVEEIAQALDGDFKVYIPLLLPSMLDVLDTGSQVVLMQKVLYSLNVFGLGLEEYLHLVIPVLVGLFAHKDMGVVKASIKVIGSLSGQVNFGDQSSRIVLPLTRLFGTRIGIEGVALDTICAIACQMDSEFKIFIPLVDKAVKRAEAHHSNYTIVRVKILSGELVPRELGTVKERFGVCDLTK
jgi:FKBP12-rapamycin complex-associated protein